MLNQQQIQNQMLMQQMAEKAQQKKALDDAAVGEDEQDGEGEAIINEASPEGQPMQF